MRIQVLLFASLAEAVGESRLTIDLAEGAKVGDALDQLATSHKSIASARATLAAAVDDRYASSQHALTDGCTLALIPPVSGG